MIRQKLYRQIEPSAWPAGAGLSPFNTMICIAIGLAVLLAIIETEKPVLDAYHSFFTAAEAAFFGLFVTEYGLRVYVSKDNPRFDGHFGRLRYMASFWSVLDLLALCTFMLPFTGGSSTFALRLSRVVRILRVARLGRFSRTWLLLSKATHARRYELIMSGVVALVLLITSSSFLYLFEAPVQPEAFGSIPRALWWSVATLTTVGYGDVTPVTAPGQLFAGLTAITGIGLVAMPTGILAAAFSDAFQEQRDCDNDPC
jgi:voltage-gated potassium channel